ncbi:MAG: Tex family protein [Muribaculaceae bacterium]|nr:Tex family protein [Bacteroidales bacterium]MDY4810671.1 Tex family protein [Muribaculaceae bacterium]
MPTIQQIIAQEMNLPEARVNATLKLLAEGATIPFISRYRKEVTGGMDEVTIFNIAERFDALRELADRKLYILQAIEAQEKLTPELREKIENSYDAAEIEDLYLPYKPKRRTKAQVARENGLEPLAKIIMARHSANPEEQAAKFLNDNVKDAEAAIDGAADIIAEWISEDQRTRRQVRNRFQRTARIISAAVKAKEEEADKYRSYFKVNESLANCSSHRYLAMRRGQAEGLLKVSVEIDDDAMIGRIRQDFTKPGGSKKCQEIVDRSVADAYKRLIKPSITTEVENDAKLRADRGAIEAFASNVHQLLLAPPLGARPVMGVDPGYRTGCKIVCLDANGNLLHHDVIYPTPPRNYILDAQKRVLMLVERYGVEAIAIGNGTASRETEKFMRSLQYPHKVEIFVVSEDGASVYSASKIARDEFPDQDVTVRGAVSIGRRLMDPLAELVKIDPKSIGVGQYQHDVDQTMLKRQLDATVESCVNTVGIDVNTASRQLLSYVSGIGDTLAANIVNYRAEHGDFTSRASLLKVPRLGPKAYEQCAGFLRVRNSRNILDNTAVHPERYPIVERIARESGHSIADLVANPALLDEIDLNKYVDDQVGLPTLTDIIAELRKPGRDPREKATEFSFDDAITDISDLHEGMILPGIVNNITDFGAFIDLGVHTSGLIHISQMGDRRVKHPSEVLKLRQTIKVRVIGVDLDRKRISLSLRGVEQ